MSTAPERLEMPGGVWYVRADIHEHSLERAAMGKVLAEAVLDDNDRASALVLAAANAIIEAES